MAEKRDRRVEKTRNAIINSFKEMIIEKDFRDITIKELAERANINRKTFYLHYQSIDEILFDLSLELSDHIFDILKRQGFFDGDGYHLDLDILINSINDCLTNDFTITKRLISSDSYHFFIRNIKDLFKEAFIRKIKKEVLLDEYKMNLVGDYIGSGVAKILKDWFNDQGNMSAHDISTLISTLVFNGVNGLLNWYVSINFFLPLIPFFCRLCKNY